MTKFDIRKLAESIYENNFLKEKFSNSDIEGFYDRYNLSNASDYENFIIDNLGYNWNVSGASLSTYYLPEFIEDKIGERWEFQVRFSDHSNRSSEALVYYELKDFFDLITLKGIDVVKKIDKQINQELKKWWDKNKNKAEEIYLSYKFASKNYDEDEVFEYYVLNSEFDKKAKKEISAIIEKEFDKYI